MNNPISTSNLILREISTEDIESIHQLNSIPEVDQFNTLGIPNSIDDTKVIIHSLIQAQIEIPRIRYVWAITSKDNKFMGLIGMNLGKLNYRSAEIWYKLNPIYWNKGYATEALKSVLHFGFNELKLHRIIAGCATENIASMKVLEKSGFIKEAHHRKILPIRGQWIDNYEFAILEEDFHRDKNN